MKYTQTLNYLDVLGRCVMSSLLPAADESPPPPLPSPPVPPVRESSPLLPPFPGVSRAAAILGWASSSGQTALATPAAANSPENPNKKARWSLWGFGVCTHCDMPYAETPIIVVAPITRQLILFVFVLGKQKTERFEDSTSRQTTL